MLIEGMLIEGMLIEGMQIEGFDCMRETLCSLFAEYSKLSDLIPPPSGGDKVL